MITLRAQAENGAADQRVFAPGQFEIEAGAERQDRRDPADDLDVAVGRLADAADELQQRRLAGAVAADDAASVSPRRTSKLTSRSTQCGW